jgi:glycerate kinase
MHVLIAPQEFKGSLSAEEAADAIARGFRRARPEWTLDLLPMSDGGPGLLEAFRRAVRSDTVAAVVHDALGRRVLARYLTVRGESTVIVEAAHANGLMHLAPAERDALMASSAGVGEIIAGVATLSPANIIIGVGGSATPDGGAGMARALGARFLKAEGRELPPGGGALAQLECIEWQPPAWLAEMTLVVATDVTNPLLGANGAARVFAPQKGASENDVELLESALTRYAGIVRRDLGAEIAAMPGAGAAGGLAGGLVAFLGARIGSGFDVVASASNLEARLAAADLVVTGEGSFDSQSLQGKVTGRMLGLAAEGAIPVVIFAGRSDSNASNVHTLAARHGEASMRDAGSLLTALAQSWATDRE